MHISRFRRPTREFAGPKRRAALQLDVRMYDVFHPEVFEEKWRKCLCLNYARGAPQLSDLSRILTGTCGCTCGCKLPAEVTGTGIGPTNSDQWKSMGQLLTG